MGILFTQRTQVDSCSDSGLWSITSHPCLLPVTPITHSYGKLVQPDFPAFSNSLYIRLWIFLLPLWFCWKGPWFPAHRFPPAISLQHPGKSISFCQSKSRAWGTYVKKVPALLSFTAPSPFGSPSCMRPSTPDRYEGPSCYKQLPSSWNYSSGANRNAMPGGNGDSWQIPSPVFRYDVSSALHLC